MGNNRIKILSISEIKELYSIPQFTVNEQQAYFSLNKKEYNIMRSRKSIASKVHFILQLGYFKATSQFFNCKFSEVKNDCNFILHEYFSGTELNVNAVSKQTRHTNQSLIGHVLAAVCDKNKIYLILQKMLKTKARLSNNPIYLFHEVLCYCEKQKLMLLAYSSIQKLIGSAIFSEEKRLGRLLDKLLSENDRQSIKNILKKDDREYLMSALKQDPKSFQLKHVKSEIKKLEALSTIYATSGRILPKLALSNKSVNYYADLAEHYSINNLNNLSSQKQAIYILCFALNKSQKINDNLTVSFTHYINKFKNEASTKAMERIINEKIELNDDTQNAALVLRFFDDNTISDQESFGRIRKKAFKYIKKGKFTKVSDYLLGVLFDYQAIKWEEIKALKHKIATNLRPIFNVLEFSATNNKKCLILAIEFLKKYFSATTKEREKLIGKAPIECIPAQWRKYLMVADNSQNKETEHGIDIAKYEFMIYQLIFEQIEAGHVYVENSISFKSLSDHLINT